MEKRTFENNKFRWEETAQDNKFYFSHKDATLVPTENEAYFAFVILYRDVLFDGNEDIDFNCTYDEKHNRIIVVVTQKGTRLMPKALLRTRNHMPMPSFFLKLGEVRA